MEVNMSDQPQTTDLSRLEDLLVDLNKSLQAQQQTETEDNSAEIIAKGADQILEQNKAMIEALVKGLEDMSARLDAFGAKIESLEGLDAKIEKGFSDLSSQPVAAKAVTTEPELAPADRIAEAPVVSRQDVLNKAMTELKVAEGDRRFALMKGIAMLDSHYSPAEVASDLNLQ
jgi:replication fork clamp-binding protein CrfC